MPDAILFGECLELFTAKHWPIACDYLLWNTMGRENRSKLLDCLLYCDLLHYFYIHPFISGHPQSQSPCVPLRGLQNQGVNASVVESAITMDEVVPLVVIHQLIDN